MHIFNAKAPFTTIIKLVHTASMKWWMRAIHFTRTLDCKVPSGAYGLTPVPSCGPLHSNSASPGLGFPVPTLPVPALWKKAHRALNVPLAHGKGAGDGSYCVYYPDTQYLKRSQKSGSLGGKEEWDYCLPRGRCSRDGKRQGKPFAPCVFST